MKKETFEAQKAFAGEKKPSMLRRCVGHDYTGRQIYMITMVTEGRRSLFGQVAGKSDAQEGNADEPRIELTELGQRVADEWWAASQHHPEIEVVALQMMPDHLHGILFVRDKMEAPLGMALRGFKQSCNRHYRSLFPSLVPYVALPTQHTKPRDRRGEDRSHVLSKNPTVLTFTFGMNDTGYYEYNNADSAAFARQKLQEARERFALCEEKLKSLKGIRTVMIGTSPYDQTSTFNDDIFAHKNDNMQRVIALQEEAAKRNGWEFLDLNKPMVALNMKQQESDPAYTLIGSDRIHPDNDGHMAIAYLFLQAQGMKGKKVADMQLDVASGKATRAENCRISKVKKTADGLQFDCLAASLPFPLDTVPHGWGFNNGAAKVTKVIPTFIDDLSDEHLTVTGLSGNLELSIDGIIIDTLSAATLSAGINLSRYRHTPQYQQALTVMALNETRWEVERRFREWAWVNYDFMMPAGFLNDNSEQAARKFRELCKGNDWLASKRGTYDQMVRPEVREAYEKEMDLLVDRIYELNQPKQHTFRLRKL